MTNPPSEKPGPQTKPTGEVPKAAASQGSETRAVVYGTDPEKLRGDEDASAHGEQELYGGGHISAPIPKWLLVVYFVLFAWGLYYAYKYWGGLGPGLDYSIVQIDHLTGRALG
jgi:hypothetical protein